MSIIKDYTFVFDGITVHFRLVDATTEQNNNKESKDSKRTFMLFTEDEETQTITIPVWPHPDFAMEFTKDNHIANCEAKELSLVKWMANWVPKLDEVSIEIAVFPTGDGECVTIEAKEFTEEIDPDVL